MKKITTTTLLLFLFLAANAQNNLPKVVFGKINRIENFKSEFVTSRNIDVWVPENYAESKKYAILYMHDGQMLFDPKSSWNKQAWNIDDLAAKILPSQKIKEFIVVGIWNGGATRHSDYFPQKPFHYLSKNQKDTFNLMHNLNNHMFQ